ncbi:MAG: hypothetical protein M3Z98_00775 [Candidatus Dormibacteraeota bacterium]|nr:hypothetical protein [Candidatus Dormibacteraeota bacterium]
MLGEGNLGTTWSGPLDDGTVVAAKRLKSGAISPSLAQIGRLSPSSTKTLLPLIGVDIGRPDQWVFSELESGVSLRCLLEQQRMAPMCAVAVAMCALDALAALHQVGLWHGAVHAGNVHIDPEGSVRLGDYCLTARGTLSEGQARAADIQAVGVLLCAMLRVRARPGASQGSRSKTARSELVKLARQLAGGPPAKRQTTHAAVDARLAVWETAGRLATRRTQSQAKARLSEMVAGPPPPPRQSEAPSPPAVLRPPTNRQRRTRTRLGFAIAAAAALALATLAGSAGLVGFFNHPARVAAASSAPHPVGDGNSVANDPPPIIPALPTAAPTVPVMAPAAAGGVTGVVLRLAGSSCAATGGVCPVHLEVWLHPTPRAQLVSWTFESIQPCTGAVVEIGAGSLTAQPGWTHVASETSLTLPAAAYQALLAVSALPDQAASPTLLIGSAAC